MLVKENHFELRGQNQDDPESVTLHVQCVSMAWALAQNKENSEVWKGK